MENLDFRRPTNKEKNAIYRYMKKQYKQDASGNKISGISFLILATLCLLSGLNSDTPIDYKVMTIIVAISLIVMSFFCFKRKDKDSYEIDIFNAGDFLVLDANVINTYPAKRSTETTIEVKDLSGKELSYAFDVEEDGLNINDPVILVYIDKEKSPDKKEFFKAFTEYMLKI